MKKILITGASGLLGSGLIKTRPKDFELILVCYEKRNNYKHPKVKNLSLDITNKNDVLEKVSKEKPNVIIHAASLGNVDLCEKEKEKARKVNVEGTENVIEAAKKIRSKIVFTSTNAVFNGQKAPYREEDKPSPLNYYGKTKYQGEIFVQKSSLPFLIVRLITMYGWPQTASRENPVTWLLSRLINKEKVKLVNDIYFNPLYNLDAAEAIWRLIQKNKTGIYHIAGKERTNRFDWGIVEAKIFGLNSSLINPVPNSFFKDIAPRPYDTTYNISKIKKEIGFKPKSLKEGMTHMRNHPLKI